MTIVYIINQEKIVNLVNLDMQTKTEITFDKEKIIIQKITNLAKMRRNFNN